MLDNLQSSLTSRVKNYLWSRIKLKSIAQTGFALFSFIPGPMIIPLLLFLLLVLIIIWYFFFFNGRNPVLALCEMFWRGITRFFGMVVRLVGASINFFLHPVLVLSEKLWRGTNRFSGKVVRLVGASINFFFHPVLVLFEKLWRGTTRFSGKVVRLVGAVANFFFNPVLAFSEKLCRVTTRFSGKVVRLVGASINFFFHPVLVLSEKLWRGTTRLSGKVVSLVGALINFFFNPILAFSERLCPRTTRFFGKVVRLVGASINFFFNPVLAFYERFWRGTTRLSGKVVWLVGASTNLGEGMVLKLATSGAKLILSARKTDILEKIKTDCIEKSKGKLSESDIFVLPFDVTEMNEKYVQNAIDHFGKIDVFISNVGQTEQGQASEVDIQLDKELFDANFFGPVFLAKHVVKHFMEMHGGKITVISSLSGKSNYPGQASDSASRQALHGYFDALRLECKRQKIYVTVGPKPRIV